MAAALHHAATASASASSVSFKRVQMGIGKLVATADCADTITRLTQTSHQAPARWIPLTSSAVQKAGASLVYMSNYGGGLLAGDHLTYHVTVQEKARFGLVTQGSNRIYRQRGFERDPDSSSELSRTELHLTVEKDALLVVAPDPVTPFTNSLYQQDQYIRMDPAASICVVDWFSSGRFANGERWEQKRLVNRTEMFFSDKPDRPFLIDSFSLDPSFSRQRQTQTEGSNASWGFDWSHVQWNAYASVFLFGDQVQAVVERCQGLQEQLAFEYTSIRQSKNDISSESEQQAPPEKQKDMILDTLSGRVLLGVSKVPTPHGNVHVARFVATSNEDLYRVFHHCLEPLALGNLGTNTTSSSDTAGTGGFGIEFYKDRIRAERSAAVAMTTVKPTPAPAPAPVRHNKPLSDPQQTAGVVNGDNNAPSLGTLPSPAPTTTTKIDGSSYWAAYMLADSCLPVGSFAHSTGLEAASQLGLLRGKDDLSVFCRTATRSNMPLACPLVKASHRLVVTENTNAFSADAWLEIDRYTNALLASNAPACRASLDQGRSLLRVASKWLETESTTNDDDDDDDQAVPSATEQVLHKLQHEMDQSDTVGHLASTFGVVTALLDLSEDQACRLIGFCVARDIVSASVRLNLVGPMAGVKLLAQTQEAAEEGIAASSQCQQHNNDDGIGNLSSLAAAAGCSPVLDAIQPCHDLLAVRLFRT
jgi:urease accessory protein UreH/urease accessory protein UreF